jgi:hypothetical protein
MKTPAEKQQAYEDRRNVRPRFTLAQAHALSEYLERKSETEALGTPLSYVRREMTRAIDEAVKAVLFP